MHLCIVTQVILILQGLLVLFTGAGLRLLGINVPAFIITGTVFLAAMVVVHFLAAGISSQRQAQQARWLTTYTVRHASVFGALMEQAKEHPYQPQDVTEILGNPDSDYRIGLYLSKTCGHCHAMQPQIDAFIETFGAKFAIEKIYTDDWGKEAENDFLERTQLKGTPTVMLNRYEIPDQCTLTDVGYIV